MRCGYCGTETLLTVRLYDYVTGARELHVCIPCLGRIAGWKVKK